MTRIIGTDGDNQLLGTSGNDVINGKDGNDYIYGNGGADRMIGGKGDDALDSADGDTLSDTVLGGGGDDRIGGNSGDRLDGGAGVDFFSLYLQGSSAALKLDLNGLTRGGTLHLHDGTFVTHMESGQINLGTGNDKVSVGNAHVAVFGGGGNDILTGGNGADTLGAGTGDDQIDGGKGSDWVSYKGVGAALHVDLNIQGEAQDTGGGGSDTLISIENLQGSGNDDVLIGDNHANKIDSYGGADTLTGGAGADTFVFTYAGQSQAFSPVTITDLSDQDTIDLSGIDADSHTDGDQAFTQVGHFNGHAGQLIVFKNGSDTVIQMDTNGDGSADEGIVLTGDHHTFDHFIL
jgi:Ca2+-binding RTX toxin-like protein